MAQSILKRMIYSWYANSNKNLSKFKDIHKGEECYVIGDGASIKWFDLSRFESKPSFVLSFLFFHNDFNWNDRLLYAPINTPYYFYPYTRLPAPFHKLWKNNIQVRYREFIEQYKAAEFFVNLSNYPVLRENNVNYLFQSIPGFDFINECLSQQMDPFSGAFRAAISLAVFMGFTKIFLVGCDYTHRKSRSRHWYEYGPGVIVEQPGYNKEFFEVAAKYVEIITVTLEGDGLYLSSVEYEKYTNFSPNYKENYDLVGKDDLLLLDTWPGYSMFPNVE
ncbi:MAG: hypothetical protein P1U39_03720 [Legionellaceae bacterium]|nr:hypothetical protein [Legionellaceae bacterium]